MPDPCTREVELLYINGEMLKISGLKVSDAARIEIEFDTRPRESADARTI